MNKHTPGPWKAEPAHRLGFVVYANVEPYVVVESADDEGRYGAIALEADARLIAAAPELLEALEDLVRLAEMSMREAGEYMVDDELTNSRAAIAKARGEK